MAIIKVSRMLPPKENDGLNDEKRSLNCTGAAAYARAYIRRVSGNEQAAMKRAIYLGSLKCYHSMNSIV